MTIDGFRCPLWQRRLRLDDYRASRRGCRAKSLLPLSLPPAFFPSPLFAICFSRHPTQQLPISDSASSSAVFPDANDAAFAAMTYSPGPKIPSSPASVPAQFPASG